MNSSAFPLSLKGVASLAAAIASLAPALAFADIYDCRIDSARGDIKHVIHIQFDNTHLRRDNPNVQSDLEQMPHLLDFIKGNGTLLANDHTILISHTAGGILSTLTGVYPDRHGRRLQFYSPGTSGCRRHRRLRRSGRKPHFPS